MPETKYKIGCIPELKVDEIILPTQSKVDLKSNEKFDCPACNYSVFETDDYCPACGLYF